MRKNKFLRLLLTAGMVVFLTALTAISISALEGNGTLSQPYQISSEDNLSEFCTTVNGGEPNAHAILTEDIALTSPWTMIGTSVSPYSGTFNGNNHTITINGDFVTLFHTIAPSGIVKNLTIAGEINESIALSTTVKKGIIVTINNGTIENCINEANIAVTVINPPSQYTSSFLISGICGENSGTVRNCTNNGNLTITNNVSDFSIYAGGIVAQSRANNKDLTNAAGTIENCKNFGTISCEARLSNIYIGGILGGSGVNDKVATTITNCNNYAAISGFTLTSKPARAVCVGGITGTTQGITSACENTGDISSSGRAGGMIGSMYGGIVSRCINTGKVLAKNENDDVNAGGIVGMGQTGLQIESISIIDCANDGEVESISKTEPSSSSGIIGFIILYHSDLYEIKNCENTGKVTSTTGGMSGAGGIIGAAQSFRKSAPATIINCANSGIISSVSTTAGEDSYAGGLVGGFLVTNTGEITIKNSANSGTLTSTVNGKPAYVGGLIGGTATPVTIKTSYWLNTQRIRGVADGNAIMDADCGPYNTDSIIVSGSYGGKDVAEVLNKLVNSNPQNYLLWYSAGDYIGFQMKARPVKINIDSIYQQIIQNGAILSGQTFTGDAFTITGGMSREAEFVHKAFSVLASYETHEELRELVKSNNDAVIHKGKLVLKSGNAEKVWFMNDTLTAYIGKTVIMVAVDPNGNKTEKEFTLTEAGVPLNFKGITQLSFAVFVK